MSHPYRVAERKIKTRTRYWERLLGIKSLGINVEHVYIDGFRTDGDYTEAAVLADTTAYWEYRSAKIRWFLAAIVRCDDEAIEEAIVHELVHVLLNPMEGQLIKPVQLPINEFTVETTTKAILNVYKSAR